MNYREETPEVFYSTLTSPVFGQKERAFLIEKANKNPRRRARICFHEHADAEFHEMFILHYRDAYVRPHSHRGKPESIHVIEGNIDLVLFTEAGQIEKVVSLSNHSTNTSYCRMREQKIHMLRIQSEFAIFHESTRGPFVSTDTVFPHWAPEEHQQPEVSEFLSKIDLELST